MTRYLGLLVFAGGVCTAAVFSAHPAPQADPPVDSDAGADDAPAPEETVSPLPDGTWPPYDYPEKPPEEDEAPAEATPAASTEGRQTARVIGWMGRSGPGFLVGVVLMLVGIVIARREQAARLSSSEAGGVQVDDPVAAATRELAEILTELEALPTATAGPNQELRRRLGVVLDERIPTFLELRELLIAKMGLGPFAEMIGDFAAMERSVARAWSALVDQAPHETTDSLERALAAGRRTATHLPPAASVAAPTKAPSPSDTEAE